MTSASQQSERKRPLSPHLSIYKPQITSVISILHRITGVALFAGLLSLLWAIIYLIYTPDSVNSSVWLFLNSIYGKILLIAWSYSLFFHACSGVRHLFWDMGYGFELCTVTWSGWLVVVMSILLTAGCWFVVLV